MKLYFKFVSVLFFFVFINFISLSANEFKEVYIIELGKIDIGKILWDVRISNNNYKIIIRLKSKGFLSKLFKFEGNYEVDGNILKDSLLPVKYKQFWLTKKKKREVEIFFNNGSVTELIMLPAEKEYARINYIEIKNYLDPLSSFFNILVGGKKSKTIDGRRVYSMIVEKENIYENSKIIRISIKNYVNIWADHKRNNLEYIEIKQENNEEFFSMPEMIKIKFKGLLYKLRKI